MTDNEIIRALEKSMSAAIEQGGESVAQMLKNAVDLINSQKAEIERLKSFENKWTVIKMVLELLCRI